ncbi:MAG: phenylalanine--tRNA ligase subunit alpha [Patescibacteria group bacterium]
MSDYTISFENCLTVNECLKVKEELLQNDQITLLKEKIKTSLGEERKNIGIELNEINKSIKESCDTRIRRIQEEQEKDVFTNFDPTFQSNQINQISGKLHPLTYVMKELVDIFVKMGYQIADGPLVEEQWFNFTSLNMPDYHPARGMQDTFYLKNKDSKDENLLLRTQTSAVQVRFGSANKPPFKVVVPGMVFRNEDIDATHDINFYQLECMYVDKSVSISQLKTLILQVFQEFFKKEMQVRLRPSYFPFVNPGMEGDISCPFCDGKGCKICKQTGWIECFGAGLVHPTVLTNMGINPSEYQGLAFAFGVDRMAQFKLGVSGISQFYNGRLEFLKQ